ncbi:MAG: transcription antitermination factor NusB [Thermaerobacter sp.]|nr:transcription antitermination factor NusB [Thermaerobacter sp.]
MARHHARELALRVLFEQDLAHTAVDELLERTLKGVGSDDRAFATLLVSGTNAHLAALDTVIAAAAIDWKVRRMPTIDRNILRLAAYEMVHERSVPVSVIIDEAVELAQSYSTPEAKRFVNGVLATLSRTIRPEGDPDRVR